MVRAQRKNLAKIMASSADVMRVQGSKVNARWVRDFAASDPAPFLGRVTVPTLAITGGHDLQVRPDDVAATGRLVQGPFEGHVVGELSHLLRPDPGSVGPRGYKKSRPSAGQPASTRADHHLDSPALGCARRGRTGGGLLYLFLDRDRGDTGRSPAAQ